MAFELPDVDFQEWARKHAAANAKLEGRELPEDYVRPEKVQAFLDLRAAKGWCAPSATEYGLGDSGGSDAQAERQD